VTQTTEQSADQSPDYRPPARLTGRGAVLAMFALFFGGAALADLLHLGVLVGFSFLAGCLLVVRFTRRSALLIVVVSPPLIFLIAVACAESLSSSATGHSRVLSAAEGTVLTLAAAAPWLLGGEALGLVLALFRGLPQCIRDLRAGLRGPVSPGARAPWADPQ
jgi:hypothetical protein